MALHKGHPGTLGTQVVPAFQVDWTDGTCDWRLEPTLPGDTPPAEIVRVGSGNSVRFSFSAPASRLSAIRLRTFTYARKNQAKLWCRLTDRYGTTIKAAILGQPDILDGGDSLVLDLRDMEFEIGAEYVFHATSQSDESDGFGVLIHSVKPGRWELHRRIHAFRPDRSFASSSVYGRQIDFVRHDLVVVHRGAWVMPPGQIARTTDAMRQAFGDTPYAVVDLDRLEEAWPVLATARVVVFSHVFDAVFGPFALSFDSLAYALHRLGVVTCFLDTSSYLGPDAAPGVPLSDLGAQQKVQRAQRQRCHVELLGLPVGAHHRLGPPDTLSPCPLPLSIDALSTALQERRKAHVVVVSVLYRKASVIRDFITRMLTQTYEGPITLVLVDDHSPEDDAEIAEGIAEALDPAGNRRIHVVRQEANRGNCAARLAGLQAVAGDIYVVMDCDCLVNDDFVAAHVFEHTDPKTDVVIGLMNIESESEDPVSMVRRLDHERQSNPRRLLPLADLQDPVQLDGFLNCITRNFSIKSRWLEGEPLFDEDFSYSAKPGSGFGWEDVEMGYRLYRKGAVIRFTDVAFSVHCTHDSSMSEHAKVGGSMRNFLKLFTKHDEMRFVARRWALETYRRLADWADSAALPVDETRTALDALFAEPLRRGLPLNTAYRPGHRRLRVLTYRWHVPHQYELYKLPHDFTLVTGLTLPMVDSWAHEQRPLPANVRFVPLAQIRPEDYDVAILHFDENALSAEYTNGVIPAIWGDPFRTFLAFPGLPKVAICHGTPTFEGQYGLDPGRKLAFVEHRLKKAQLVEALRAADVHVVCNSHQAFREWNFARSRVIWHGLDPQQFPPGTRTRDILALAPDRHRPHYRGAWEQEIVAARLSPGIRIESAAHPGCAIERRDGNPFAEKNFRSYIDRIRQFRIYLNTTLRSPMPRSRGEAMMTGVVPVCLANHDAELFIENGRNGFVSNEPEELADFINHALAHPEVLERLSAGARATALDVFNHDRYLGAWTDLLRAVCGHAAGSKAAA